MKNQKHIAITQEMNSTMNLTVDGESVITMPTREDVARLESKVDQALALLTKLTDATFVGGGPITLEDESSERPTFG